MKLWLLGMLLMLSALGAHAETSGYPRTIVDLAGRSVSLQKPVQRIYLQNGNHLMLFAILERENPFARIAVWNNGLRASDPTLWALFEQTWPQAARIPQLRFESSGDGDLEGLVWANPDLLVLDLTSRAAVESGALGPLLERLHIPIVYIDTVRNPLAHTRRSIEVLGQVLSQETRARDYLAFYQARLDAIQEAIIDAPKPTVFIEARAGRLGLDQCCYSQNGTAWARLIEASGANNYASAYLPGATGDIAIEMLIANPPDVYLMTGTPQIRQTSRAIPFGYGVGEDAVQSAMALLMQRPGFERIAKRPDACVIGISHQFFDSALNIVGIEYLAKALHPQRLQALSPDDDYREMIRRFTQLPDRPFVFSAQRRYSGEGSCEC